MAGSDPDEEGSNLLRMEGGRYEVVGAHRDGTDLQVGVTTSVRARIAQLESIGRICVHQGHRLDSHANLKVPRLRRKN